MPNNPIDILWQSLTPEYRLFLESDFTEVTALEFGTAAGLSGRDLEILENSIIFYLLAITDTRATIGFIHRNCNLSEVDCEYLWMAIEKSIPQNVKEAIANSTLKTFLVSSTTNSLASEISAVEQDLAALKNVSTKPLETVEVRPVSDVVYQSSQADILQKPAPVVNNLVPPTPRWDTDTQK